MWRKNFTAYHKNVCKLDCFFGLLCFSLPDAAWQTLFSSHAQHGSMQRRQQCGCGGMQRLLFPFTRLQSKAPKTTESNKTTPKETLTQQPRTCHLKTKTMLKYFYRTRDYLF
jgi:hypothetical protein